MGGKDDYFFHYRVWPLPGLQHSKVVGVLSFSVIKIVNQGILCYITENNAISLQMNKLNTLLWLSFHPRSGTVCLWLSSNPQILKVSQDLRPEIEPRWIEERPRGPIKLVRCVVIKLISVLFEHLFVVVFYTWLQKDPSQDSHCISYTERYEHKGLNGFIACGNDGTDTQF